jgi:triacylglycerol lipase
LTAQAATAQAAAAPAKTPVVIVGGTFAQESAYVTMETRLHADGRATTTVPLPENGQGSIPNMAKPLVDAIDALRARTGAPQIDIVAHSMGAPVARYYIKYLGGLDKVRRYVSLGGPEQGTAIGTLGQTLWRCFTGPLCAQISPGSPLLTALNTPDDTPGNIQYTTIRTLYEEAVIPATNAKLKDGATDILVQNYCQLSNVDHVGLAFNGAVYGLIRSALDGGPISTNCAAV